MIESDYGLPEPKCVFVPLPVVTTNQELRVAKKHYAIDLLIFQNLPIQEKELIKILNYVQHRWRKEDNYYISFLLSLGLLIKVKGKIYPTKKFIDFIERSEVEIQKYEDNSEVIEK